MSTKHAGDAEARERADDKQDELLDADGQSARLVSNTTGEYSLDRAREGFDKAFSRESEGDAGTTNESGS